MKVSPKVFPIFLLAALVFCGLATVPARPRQESPQEAADLAARVRLLRQSKTLSAYAGVKKFADQFAGKPLGIRAALALGNYDYANKRFDSAAAWLRIAQGDPVLGDYAKFWLAQSERAAGRPAAAIPLLESVRSAQPRSLLAPEAAEALALAALAAGDPEKTVEAFSGNRMSRPDILLARGQAYEKLGQQARAARDYNSIYYLFPLSPEAAIVAPRLLALRGTLKQEFPAVPAEQVRERIQGFVDAKRCTDARREWQKLGPSLPAASRDSLNVRITACVSRGAVNPLVLAKLMVTDAEADAERLYFLSQAYRGKRDEARMVATVEEVALRAPASPWTARALFAAGNYFWTQLDQPQAALFYKRLYDAFPEAEDSHAAHWRMAWEAYRQGIRKGESSARALLEEHLRRFRGSQHTVNALYWLGRVAERENQQAEARAFYVKAIQRFPQTYYGQRAAERMRDLGMGVTAQPEILASIPEPPAVADFDASHAPEVMLKVERARARAEALAGIGADGYAERELVAGFQETHAPELLLAAAQLAQESDRYYNGIVLGRRLVPQIESRRLQELPEEVWRTVYPYVYGEGIEATASMAQIDPMLVAGLIRQESVFQASAVSRAGAIGLMQVMPGTGRQLARQLRLSYTKKKLFQPEFNLRLGTTHLARLVREFDSVEAALAAYNAGEARVAQWRNGRTFSEPAEFVESIPFTETREYVQIVLRNREIYRSLYGRSPKASASSGNGK